MENFLKEILADNYNDEVANKIISKINENYTENQNVESKIKELEKSHKEQVYEVKLNNAIEKALNVYGARNSKAVTALIDKTQIEIDEKGQIAGLDNQLSELKKSDSFLFENSKVKGLSPAQEADTSFKSMKEMNYSELCQYLKTKENNV